MTRFEQLNNDVLQAHMTKDYQTLIDIYYLLGREELANNDITAGSFLLTQAYVYALESDDSRVKDIYLILKSYGREE